MSGSPSPFVAAFDRIRCATNLLLAVIMLAPSVRIAQAEDPKDPDRPPNIVFIMADDLGYGHLGSYGQELIETPHLDRLASEGVRFTQVYAGAPVCAPSRSVLMTGLHMGHTPVRGNSGGIPLRPEDVTVAEVLQEAGYATGIFGKWGLGEFGTDGMPTRQGFDEFAGYLHQIHAHFYYPEYLWKNETKWPLPGNEGGGRYPGDGRGERTQYAPAELLDHALNFIRANQDRPFFAYIPTVIPHVEVVAPEEDVAQYAGRWEEERCADPRGGYAHTDQPKATYAAMISHMDRNVGRVLDELESLGLEENTLVVFTSDNGAQSGYCTEHEFFNASGPLRDYKTSVYEGGLRVPTIARWPGKIEPARVSDDVWYFPDILPTFAEVAGTQAPEGLDGHSVVPALLGQEQPEHEVLYWEHGSGPGRSQAVRMGPWKGVRTAQDAQIEIYNLEDDPGESTDLASRHPDVLQRIERCFEECRTEPRPQVEPVRVQGRSYR